MPPDESALLAAVAADPGNDLPRLVYADWLDDHGHPRRAAFIRAQCELARTPPDTPRADALTRDAFALYDDPAELFHPWADPRLVFFDFARGFVTEATLFGWQFLRPGPALGDWLAGCTPRPDRVELMGVGNRPAELRAAVACPGLVAVTHLTAHGEKDKDWPYLRPADAAALAGCPFLTRLQALDTDECDMGAAGLETLLRADPFPVLTDWDLSCNGLGDAGAELLAGWPGLARLQRLGLGRNGLTDAGARALVASPFAPPVLALGLDWTDLSAGVRGLLAERFGPGVVFGPDDRDDFTPGPPGAADDSQF